MRYSEMVNGMHVVRTRELSWARRLTGVVCLVKGFSDDKLLIQRTIDCAPVGNVMSVPVEGDDGYWYDVSDLIMDANSVILPSGEELTYSCPVETNYRNFVGCDNLKPFIGDNAAGEICLIGERQANGRVVFSKTGYYVVGVDCNGYAVVYQGFCEYADSNTPRKLTLRVFNLSNTERDFYPAADILNACHKAYQEDCTRAKSFREEIKESTLTSSTESSIIPNVLSGVDKLSLEDTHA